MASMNTFVSTTGLRSVCVSYGRAGARLDLVERLALFDQSATTSRTSTTMSR